MGTASPARMTARPTGLGTTVPSEDASATDEVGPTTTAQVPPPASARHDPTGPARGLADLNRSPISPGFWPLPTGPLSQA